MRCISRSRTPGCSSRSLARAQDFVDVEAQGEEAGAEEDDDDDGLDLPRLSPPPALQSPAPALQSPQPALLSPQPALQSPQPVATPVTPVVAAVEVCAPPRHPPARSPAHGIGLPTLRWPLRWQPDLLDFTLPPTPSVVTPVMTTSENWVAEMESEIREFDQLTAQHGAPSSAPGAGWKQSMEEELELHLSKT